MTRSVYAQIAGAIVVATAAGWTAVALLIPLMREMVQRGVQEQLIAAGITQPLPQPPLAPMVISALVFTVVLVVTASAVVGVPLVRRLRRVGHAMGELGRGNWAMRLDPGAGDPFADLAEGFNRTAAQLQQQFQEREALMQAVSHEMGTPLSRMRFELELLDRQLPSPEHQQRLRALNSDLDDLDDLSTELVSWMDSDAAPTRGVFDARQVIDSLIELEADRDGRQLRMTLTASPGAIAVRADQRQFERAIENLLRNAMRYAQHEVVIEVGADRGAVSVEVRDDGPGISSDQWSRVLEPFVRIDSPRSRAHRGLGLGLAIVRRIVEAHGGEVTVGAAPEGGTSVRTRWPVGASGAGG